MTDDLRWAVRYAFLEDLWRDRARVIVDAGLESTLRAGRAAKRGGDAPLDDLIDALVPRAPSARTWMAVVDEAVARELAQTRPGTGFLPRASFADVVAHRDWAVALVELAALDPSAPGGARLRRQLAERAQEGRTVVVAARAVASSDDDDLGYSELVDLLEDELGGGRIFGVARPPMAAVIDFGGEDGDDDDEVALSFDNTLGSQAPQFVEYIGIVGPVDALPDGMTLVELPSEAAPVSSDDGLRAKLVSAQRQGELAAIDRQTLLEQVDELESAKAELEQQAQSLRVELGRLVNEAPPPEASDRLQAVLADNQALRWSAQKLERELTEMRARPVETLEAEVAELRARLEAHEGAAPPPHEPNDASDADQDEAAADEADVDVDVDDGGAVEVDEPGVDQAVAVDLDLGVDFDVDDLTPGMAEALERADRIRRGQNLRALDQLIARVERGGISALALRRALVSLKERLDV